MALSQQDFATTYGPLADDISSQTGLDRSAVLGVMATETGFGNHYLGNNIFGITPAGGLAKYPDIPSAGQAFVDLINKRYAPLIAASDGSPEGQIAALVKGGYNTVNPNYAAVASSNAKTVRDIAEKQSQSQAPSADDLMDMVKKQQGGPSPTAPAAPAGASQAPSPDDLLQMVRKTVPAPPGAPQAPETPETTTRGVARNVAAGVLEGSGSTINVLHDPVGNLVFRPLTTLGAAGWDYLASKGLVPPMTADQRADLTGDVPGEYQQPGTRLAQAAGASDVKPATPAEQYVRSGVSGATTALQLAPGGVVAPLVVGAGGGVGGQVAADYAPDWATPYAQLGGMLLGGTAAGLGMAGLVRGGPTAYNALQQYAANAPERPLAPRGPLPDATAANLLSPDVAARLRADAQAPPSAPSGGPQPGMGAPQPTGAQVTPTAAAQMTPEEIATQRTVADKQWLNQTQQPGVPDTAERIPGITPSLVEQEQTVQRARELKTLKNLNPELSQAEREILDRNTELRKGFYADTVGSDVTRAADLKAANDEINTDLATVWKGKGEADPANVTAQIDTELAGSAGDLPPLKSAMKQVSDSLENAGTDPQTMYRTHRLINYLQSKQGQLANPGYGAGDVQAALTRVKGVLANTIDGAAPGFGKAMSDYSSARGPIDAAKALQDRENGLYDSRGHISFLKVHALLRDIIDAQKWDAPNDPLAGVSDAQMMRLKALHDDLKRVASAKDLATAQGSDTAMNAIDVAKEAGKLAGRAGIEGAANLALGPGLGSMAVRGVENLLRPITSGIAGRRQMRRGMEILQPPPANPLQPPP